MADDTKQKQVYEYRPDVECLYEHDMKRMHNAYKPTGPHVHLIIDDEDWLSFFYEMLDTLPSDPLVEAIMIDNRLVFRDDETDHRQFKPTIQLSNLEKPLAKHVILCECDPYETLTDFSPLSTWAKVSVILYSSTDECVTQVIWNLTNPEMIPKPFDQGDLNRYLGNFLTASQDKTVRKLPDYCSYGAPQPG